MKKIRGIGIILVIIVALLAPLSVPFVPTQTVYAATPAPGGNNTPGGVNFLCFDNNILFLSSRSVERLYFISQLSTIKGVLTIIVDILGLFIGVPPVTTITTQALGFAIKEYIYEINRANRGGGVAIRFREPEELGAALVGIVVTRQDNPSKIRQAQYIRPGFANAYVGRVYSESLFSPGVVFPAGRSWRVAVTQGSLPPGLRINSGPALRLEGTPTLSGTFHFTLVHEERIMFGSYHYVGSRDITMFISDPNARTMYVTRDNAPIWPRPEAVEPRLMNLALGTPVRMNRGYWTNQHMNLWIRTETGHFIYSGNLSATRPSIPGPTPTPSPPGTPVANDEELNIPFPRPTVNLSQGSVGNTVRWLQYALNRMGESLAVDGIFGPLTRAAVARFQNANGLAADGIVGPYTRGVIVNQLLAQMRPGAPVATEITVPMGGIPTIASAGGSLAAIDVRGNNLTASNIRVAAFLNNTGGPLYTQSGRLPGAASIVHINPIVFPANAGATRIYTLRVSVDGGSTWPETPTLAVTALGGEPSPVTGIGPVPVNMTLPSFGGESWTIVFGTNLNASNMRIAAFLNNTGNPLYTQTPVPLGGGLSVSTTLNFPANTSDTSRVYTIRVSANGGSSWLDYPTRTITVLGGEPSPFTIIIPWPPAMSSLPYSGGISSISVQGNDNLSPTNVQIAAFLDNAGSPLYAQPVRGGPFTLVADLNFPRNTGMSERVYTIRASLNNGATWLSSPSGTVTVAAAEPPVIRITVASDSMNHEGGTNIVRVEGTELTLSNMRIAAFLNDFGEPLYMQTPEQRSFPLIGMAIGAHIYFPANTGTSDRVYTIRVSVDGGSTWLSAHTATVTVFASPHCPGCNAHPCKCIYTVTFDPNGGTFAMGIRAFDSTTPPALEFTTPSAITFSTRLILRRIDVVPAGEAVGNLPQMPTGASPNGISKFRHRFTGWFTDVSDEATRFRYDTIVTGNTTLFARWEPIPDNGDNGFRVGAASGNGRVTSADATMIARWLVTPEGDRANTFPNFCHLAADIDGDGEVTACDLVLLARWLVGHNVQHLIAL